MRLFLSTKKPDSFVIHYLTIKQHRPLWLLIRDAPKVPQAAGPVQWDTPPPPAGSLGGAQGLSCRSPLGSKSRCPFQSLPGPP